MRFLNTMFLLPMLISLACGEAPESTDTKADPIDESFFVDGKSDTFGVAEGSYTAVAILELCNTQTQQFLDDDVALNALAARNIVTARGGARISTLAELDAIPYVGRTAFGALQTFVETNDLVGACGDGTVLSTIEQCDDGNSRDGDGCSSTCQLDTFDGPPYQNTPIVYGFQEGSYEGLAILSAANSSTLSELDVDAQLDVRAAKKIVYGRGGGFVSLTKLSEVPYVGASAFQKLLDYARSNGFVPSCGDRSIQSVMEKCDDGNLTDGDGCDSMCRLESTCGDGLKEFAETCDDGNAVANDGCSSTCTIETRYEGNDYDNGSKAKAVEIGSFRFMAGTIRSEGDVDYWAFTLDRPSRVHIDIWGGSPNGSCRSFWHEAPSGSASTLFDPKSNLEGDAYADIHENCGSTRAERNEWDKVIDLAPGQYYIRLEGQDIGYGWDAPYTVGYGIEVLIDPIGPLCGNGQIENGESCDDGNASNLDGCSQACVVERRPEVEPNNTLSNNTSLGSYQFAQGNISAGDNDYFGFKLDAATTVSLTLNEGADCGFDGVIELYDATGTLIDQDDDSAGNYCPGLSKRLGAGTYFVNVRHTEPMMTGGAYVLNVQR